MISYKWILWIIMTVSVVLSMKKKKYKDMIYIGTISAALRNSIVMLDFENRRNEFKE